MAGSPALVVARSFEFMATVTILAFACLQLWCEKRYFPSSPASGGGSGRVSIGPMKRQFHRIIPVAALFLCIHSLYRIVSLCKDTHILPLQLMFLLKQDATFLIVCLLAIWVNHTVDTAFTLIRDDAPRLLSIILKIVVVVTFLVIHVTVFINVFVGRVTVVHAILLLWMAVAMFSILCMSLLAVYILRSRVHLFRATLAARVVLESSQFTVLASLDRALSRLAYIQAFVCIVIIPTVVVDMIAGIQMLGDNDVMFDADELDEDDSGQWQASVWFWLKFSALLVSQRITWIPLRQRTIRYRKGRGRTRGDSGGVYGDAAGGGDDDDDGMSDDDDSWQENNMYYALASPHKNNNATMITRNSTSTIISDGGGVAMFHDDTPPLPILNMNMSSRHSVFDN